MRGRLILGLSRVLRFSRPLNFRRAFSNGVPVDGFRSPSSTAPRYMVQVDARSIRSLVMSPSPVVLFCYSSAKPETMEALKTLEELCNRGQGRLQVGLLDTARDVQLAAALGIHELPVLGAYARGQALGTISGPMSKNDVGQFIQQLDLGFSALSEADLVRDKLEYAKSQTHSGNIPEAAKIYSEVLELKPSPEIQNVDEFKALSMAGLAECALAEGSADVAKSLVEDLKAKYPSFLGLEDIASVVLKISLADLKADSPFKSIEELQEKVAGDPGDLQAKYFYAIELLLKGRFDQAIEMILGILKKDKNWNEGAAKNLLLNTFNALGPDSPVSKKGRRRLANILF